MRHTLILGVLILCTQAFAGLEVVEDFNSYSSGDDIFSHPGSPFFYPDSVNASTVCGGMFDDLFDPFQFVDAEPPPVYRVFYQQGNCLKLSNTPGLAESQLVWENMAYRTFYMCFKVSGDASFDIGTVSSPEICPPGGSFDPISKNLCGALLSVVDGAMLEVNSTSTWQLNQDIWYELWIHTDIEAGACRFYIAQAGGQPQVIANPVDQSQWWPWLMPQLIEPSGLVLYFGGSENVGNVEVDLFANDNEYTLDSLYHEDGDFESRGQFSIYAFLTLKANFGTKSGATFEMGDYDLDGDVDIFDFLVLKSLFGTEY